MNVQSLLITSIKIKKEKLKMEENTTITKIVRPKIPYRSSSIRVCKNCGKFYYLADKDLLYFVNKYGTIPCKCEKCRERAKEKDEESKAEEKA